MRILKYISIISVFLLPILGAVLYRPQYLEYKGNIFNTYYRIKIFSPKFNDDLPVEIKQILQNINNQMSVFIANSELNKINQAPADKKITLSEDLSFVLQKSSQIHHETEGCFDPAIAPLIDLWGFGRKSKKIAEPTPHEIEKKLQYSSFKKLNFYDDFKVVSKQNAETELNLSAIAKGFAVDKLAQLLETKGYKNYIIEIGGEVRASGSRDKTGNGWNIGVGVPLENSLANAFVVELSNLSVATSGDYRNFVIKGNQRYSHTINPLTGTPVTNNLASTTVFAPSCMEADAYATAIMVMGEDKGTIFADNNNLAVIFFTHSTDNGFNIKYSAKAKQLLGLKNETN